MTTKDADFQEAYDVVVVGGGPAGLNAALVLGRARRRVAVVDAGAPRNAAAAHMQGFISRDGTPPAELLAYARAELSRYDVVLVPARVDTIDEGFSVRLDDGRALDCRRLLIATGAIDVLPDLPGIRERWGRDLLHCPYCHGWEVRDRPLGVLGTHPGAIQHALLVRQWSDDLVFFSHDLDVVESDQRALQSRDIRVVDGPVAGLVVDGDRLVGVQLADGRTIDREALFVRTMNRPAAADVLAGIGCEMDADGFVVVDAMGRTSIPGVWAAGNVVDPRAQVITSAGAGSAAAIAINADLVQEEVARAGDAVTVVST